MTGYVAMEIKKTLYKEFELKKLIASYVYRHNGAVNIVDVKRYLRALGIEAESRIIHEVFDRGYFRGKKLIRYRNSIENRRVFIKQSPFAVNNNVYKFINRNKLKNLDIETIKTINMAYETQDIARKLRERAKNE